MIKPGEIDVTISIRLWASRPLDPAEQAWFDREQFEMAKLQAQLQQELRDAYLSPGHRGVTLPWPPKLPDRQGRPE